MSVTTRPTVIDYTSRDWAAFRESMLDYAKQAAPEWQAAQTGDANDFGVILVELVAYQADILSYYIDRVANEGFLTTATQRSSVLDHAALLNYSPRSATAASTEAVITVTSSAPVTIPAGFALATKGDGVNDPVTFTTASDLNFPGGNVATTLTVTINEGTSVTDELVATSCGDLNAAYALLQAPVIADSLVVRVVEAPGDAGRVWNRVNNLLDATPSDNAYSVQVDELDQLTITFGDGTTGRVPPRGAVVHASYRVGGGTDGNVPVGSVTDVVDPTDFVYTDPVPGDPVVTPTSSPVIVVANQSEATGGTDSESLQSIRENAPKALKARDRAISLSDFEALALSVPGVLIGKANAVSEVYTNVTVYVAPPGGGQPTQATMNAVVDYLRPRKLANVTVVASSPQYVSIDIALTVDVDSRYAQFSVVQAVRNSLVTLLSFDSVDFAGRVTLGSVYQAVAGVAGVANVFVTKLARNGGTGVGDIQLRENELAISGAVDLLATGGTSNSDVGGDTVGDELDAVQPEAAGAAEVGLSRCDPNSLHLELSWARGASTTHWDVLVVYLDSLGQTVQTVIVGPVTEAQAVLDLPYIGAGRSSSIEIVLRAFNGSAGPVDSPATTLTYVCEPV